MGQAIQVIEAVLFIFAVALGVVWICFPQWLIEPWIVILTTLVAAVEVVRRNSFGQRVHFPENSDAFYRYYATQIASARKEIWITSDGFNMRNPKSRAYAEIMTQAFVKALSNDVVVRRFQIIDTMHLNWIAELKVLKKQFPETFRVFVNPALPAVPNVCVIDPELPRCVSERMEHRTGLFGQGSEAVSYSFSHRQRSRAQATKRMVEDAIGHPATQELDALQLDQLANDLFRSRLERLQRWCATHPGKDRDLSESGVFDERVISYFVASQRESTQTKEPERTDGR